MLEKGISNSFLSSVINGLSKDKKEIPAKFLYDYRGSELFEEITHLDSYYQTRAEISILESIGKSIGELVGEYATIVEFGAGSTRKIPILLSSLISPGRYIPIDIAGEYLVKMSQGLNRIFPHLKITPIVADFMQPITMPNLPSGTPILGFFPGSTIGNLTKEEASHFLANARSALGKKSQFLIGIDPVKSVMTLLAAYNDPEGVTAEFNLNLLVRANRELGANFNITTFKHEAIWNETESRIEMHLVSTKDQTVTIHGQKFTFKIKETIHTENSHKYTPETFAALAHSAGWEIQKSWVDKDKSFSMYLLKN